MGQYNNTSISFGGLDYNYTNWGMNIAPCFKPGTVATWSEVIDVFSDQMEENSGCMEYVNIYAGSDYPTNLAPYCIGHHNSINHTLNSQNAELWSVHCDYFGENWKCDKRNRIVGCYIDSNDMQNSTHSQFPVAHYTNMD